ncbi:hypothetical protein WJX81_004103 [Elliptochloris bilobata]|uniref:Uncharacterized protein n=1 Tax=Elliptochloris bilobata TaxID=381761 RepID=A0AAW1SHU7_9CHLO
MHASEPQWHDVQQLLASASEQLQLGELLHGEDFSLFEAMSAVEIGDPKLDAGLTVDYSLPANRPPSDEAAPRWPSSAAALAVMDRLAALEATWHADHSLAQTVFTCLYLLHPQRLEGHPVLSGYCRAVRATCCVVRDMVLTGCVCEDEDFQAHAFGLTLADDRAYAGNGSNTVLAALSFAEDWLTSRSHPSLDPNPASHPSHEYPSSGGVFGNGGGRPTANGVSKAVSSSAGAGAAGVDVRAEHAAAFLARIRFRKALLRGLQRIAGAARADLDAARKQFLAAQVELARVRASAGGGVPAEQAPGFDPDVNRRLMAPVPPRPIQVLSIAETWDYWACALAQLLRACDVVRVARWADLKPYLLDFAATLPGALARSALHCAVAGRHPGPWGGSGGGDSGAGAQTPRQPWQFGQAMVCEAVGLPPAGLPGTEAQLFVDQAVIALRGWCQAMCMNRARQRRRHRRAVEDWAFLHQHALNAEASSDFAAWLPASGWAWKGDPAVPGPLAAWVEKECADVLLQHLLLGFELGVYAPHEHCMLFWYCDYLFGTLQQAALALIAARPPPGSLPPPFRSASPNPNPQKGPALPGARGAAAAGAKGKSAAKRANVGRAGASVPFDLLSQEAREAGLERALCQAHMRLAAGLARAGRLRPGGGPFNVEAQRFEQRFSALHRLLHPEPLDYSQFASAVGATGGGGALPMAKAEQRLTVGWDYSCEPYPVLTLSHAPLQRPAPVGLRS